MSERVQITRAVQDQTELRSAWQYTETALPEGVLQAVTLNINRDLTQRHLWIATGNNPGAHGTHPSAAWFFSCIVRLFDDNLVVAEIPLQSGNLYQTVTPAGYLVLLGGTLSNSGDPVSGGPQPPLIFAMPRFDRINLYTNFSIANCLSLRARCQRIELTVVDSSFSDTAPGTVGLACLSHHL